MKIKIFLAILMFMSITCIKAYCPYSLYTYCLGDSINFIDPDGKDAIRVVDEENKTITVIAKYYVVAMDRPYRENGDINYVSGYNATDISNMSTYNDYLNSLNLTVQEGKYEGYTIKFDLSFESTENMGTADIQSRLAITENGESYGNTINRGNSYTDRKYKFNIVFNDDGSFSTVGGVTINNKYIVMNYGFDNKMNLIHEIFHTFGLDHPVGGATNGILHYPPQKPNAADAFSISTTPFMPTIIKN